MEKNKELQSQFAKIEAVLFIHGEAIGIKKLARLLEATPEETSILLKEYENFLREKDGGLTLLLDDEKTQLVTKAEFGGIIEHFIKDELSEALTPAALETLAIVAYFGPIGRMRLDYIRGVNSSFTLRNLSMRGLVERVPDSERTQSFVYRPSFEAWKHLGVSSREELPNFEMFAKLLKEEPALTNQQ